MSKSGSHPVTGMDLERPGLGDPIERDRLSGRLRAAGTPAILLHAPAGYGKSVLLAQWAGRDPRPFAAVTLTDAHNDPAVLVASLVEAFAPIEPLPETLAESITHARPNLDLIGRRLEEAMRASEWWDDADDPNRAIGFALGARDHVRAGRLIWEAVPAFNTTGRQATLQRWIERIGLERAAVDPHLSLTLAFDFLVDGDGGGADYWAGSGKSLVESTAVEGADLRAGLAIVDAALARGGVGAMRVAADRARSQLDREGALTAMADLFVGVAAHLSDEDERAHRALADAARGAAVWNAPIFGVLALGQLALLAAAEEDWPTARILASQSRAQVDRCGLIARPFVALAVAISAYVDAGEGRRAEALADLAAGRALLGRLRDFGAWFEVETAAALAAAAIELDDAASAEPLVATARRRLADLPDAPMLAAWVADLEDNLGRIAASGLADLTPAELRVLRMLPSHLSYRQIAEELIVSPNTVKTQIRSAYLKLGVSSRHEAVEACRAAVSAPRAAHREDG